jgi:hypothetical protein
VPGAKGKLKAFGAPVPQPDPNSVAWMTAEQNTPRPHTSLVKKPLTLLSNGPKGQLMVAARNGAPNLQPESEGVSPADILTPGGLSKAGAGLIAVVKVGETSEPAATSESVATPSSEDTSEPPKDAGTASATASPTASADAAKNPPAAEGATETPAKAEATAAGTEAKSDGAVAGAESKSDATDAAKTGDSQNSDPKKESSSKKKKGLRKLVPW